VSGRSLRLRVGGLVLRATAPRPGRFLAPPAEYRPFLASRGADIRLRVVEAEPPDPGVDPPLFESGGTWRVFRLGGRLLYSFRVPRPQPTVFKAVLIDEALLSGTLFFPRLRQLRRPSFALAYPLDELLFQHRWAREGALEIHACGLLVNGRAALLCGQSGAGKSTSARLWRRSRPTTRILSDDRVVLRLQRGRPVAWGTPWHGDGGFAAQAHAPLGAIFFLARGAETRATAIPPGLAAARLLARAFPPPWDGFAMRRALELVERVVKSVPCHELAFRPDRSAVREVERVMGAARPAPARRGPPRPAR
jgi:hypothetical protein